MNRVAAKAPAQNRPVELLAPAGGWPQLQAALKAGADAVFFGVEGLNMRANAKNFRKEELPEIVATAHAQGAKAYLALNTLIYEPELGALDELLEAAAQARVDAVIAADFAVVEKTRARGLPLHLSTQLSLSNSAALGFFVELGVRRFVLARECTLEQIAAIRQGLRARFGRVAEEVELEAFAHGAMCVSTSGRCSLSAHTTGKSGNRGACTQPCRREYTLVEREGDLSFAIEEGHLLSPRDLCTLPFIEVLLEAGIVSFKIEGRGRAADYVYEVVTAYREVIDCYLQQRQEPDFAERSAQAKERGLGRVRRVYNRDFDSGFYLGKPMGDWTTGAGNQASQRRSYLGQVVHFYDRLSVAEIELKSDDLALGDAIAFEGNTTGWLPQAVESMQIDQNAIEQAHKGQTVGLKTIGPVREGDRVYLMKTK